MTTDAQRRDRTDHLLALMKQGDDAFNARDFEALDRVHHPDMVANITGVADPLYGRDAHSGAMAQMFAAFPDMRVHCDPYPIQFGTGDWITVITTVTGTFTGAMTLPDGTVVNGTGKAFDVEMGQTSKWADEQLIVISAFWDAKLFAKQVGLA